MQQLLESISLKQKMPQLLKTKTTVMVIGGAEDKLHGKEILQSFFARSGGTEAQIAIVPCASRASGNGNPLHHDF